MKDQPNEFTKKCHKINSVKFPLWETMSEIFLFSLIISYHETNVPQKNLEIWEFRLIV